MGGILCNVCKREISTTVSPNNVELRIYTQKEAENQLTVPLIEANDYTSAIKCPYCLTIHSFAKNSNKIDTVYKCQYDWKFIKE